MLSVVGTNNATMDALATEVNEKLERAIAHV
jgi:hypothetical protein